MASDFFTGDIYDEAIKRLQGLREKSGQTSKAAYENLAKDTQAAYEALNREAAVNRALSERADGAARNNITTIKQRSETNLRNTLGKNSRQRERSLGAVELEHGNAEVRQAADDAAFAASFGALKDKALVEQSNFDKQYGLQQQQLDLQKQQNAFSQAYQMLSGGMMDEKGFTGVTGIKVKKPPKMAAAPTGPAVTCAGSKAPETNHEGYVTRAVRDPGGNLTYYEVREDLAGPMDEAGISPQDENGRVKSETDIFFEMYGFVPEDQNYDEVYKAIQNDEQNFVDNFGEATFWVVTTAARYNSLYVPYSSGPEGLQHEAMDLLEDMYTNPDKYIEQLGVEEYKAALDEAFIAAEAEYEAMVPKLLEYGYTPEEGMAVLGILSADLPQYTGDTLESYDMDAVAAKLNLPSWYPIPEEWDADSLYTAMCVSAYMDWSVMNIDSGANVPLPEDGPVADGARVFAAYQEQIDKALTRAAVNDTVAWNGQMGEQIGDQPTPEEQTQYTAALNLDLDAGQRALVFLQGQRDTLYNEYLTAAQDARVDGSQASIDNAERLRQDVLGLDKQIAEMKGAIKDATSTQGYVKWLGNVNAPDFDVYVEKGKQYIEDDTTIWTRDPVVDYQDYYNEATGASAATSPDDATRYSFMSDDELNVYYYLYAKDKENGTDLHTEYINLLDPMLTARKSGKATAIWEKGALEHPAAATVYSILYAPATALQTTLAFGEAQVRSALGEDVDFNDSSFDLIKQQQAIRQTVGEGLSPTGQFFYDAGMSIADNIMMLGTAGGSEAAMLTIMGGNAATSATLDALERGATQQQALGYGLLVGAAEVVFEKVSLDNLFDTIGKAGVEAAKRTFGQTVKEIFKQAGIEASEEFFTEIADTIIDATVMGDLSNYNLSVKKYMVQGMTRAEAQQKASLDVVNNVWMAALGGLLSGFVTGSAATAMSYAGMTSYGEVPEIQDGKYMATSELQDITTPYGATMDGGGTTAQNVSARGMGAAINEVASFAQTHGETNAKVEQDIADSIRENANNPATAPKVQSALIDGMSTLIGIENILRAESGNVNYSGFSADTSFKAYIDFSTMGGTIADSPAKVAKLQAAAQAIAADIGKVLATEQLTAGEVARLQGVMTELTGDANLAEVYVGQMMAGADAVSGMMSAEGVSTVNMDEEENGGYNKDNTVKRTQLSIEEKTKLSQWKYRPDDSLYLKYKAVFDNENYFDQKTGEAIYPGERGDKHTHGFVDGKSDPDTMKVDSVYKRYGNNGDAKFFTDMSTPYEQLALPPGSDVKPLLEITVLKDIPCSSGEIFKWFDQPGGGKQYFTDVLIEDDFGNLYEATLKNLEMLGYISYKIIK